MKLVKFASDLKIGDVVLVVYYDYYSFAGEADGWKSLTFSVSDETAMAPNGETFPDRKLVRPEGEPLDLARSNGRGWIPLYDEGNDIKFGYDGGAHACSVKVTVFLLQRGRVSDHGDDDAVVQGIINQQTLAFEGEL